MKITKKLALPKEVIKKIVKESENSTIATLKLYKYVFDDWDYIETIAGFPVISKETGIFIMELMVETFPEEKFPGGIWINKGFSTNDDLDDFIVEYNGEIEYSNSVDKVTKKLEIE